MSTLYLHIGTPKTGTSAIQYFCANNRGVLEEKGICYPDMPFRFDGIGRHRNAHFLSRKIYKDKKRDYEAEQALREEGYQTLRTLLQEHEKIVLSDEHLWNESEWDTQRFEEFKNVLAGMGATLKVIVYLRRQDLLVQSYWAQQVKEGLQDDFSTYIRDRKYSYFQLDYDVRLAQIAQGVSKENVLVHVYEKGQYKGKQQSILSDFLSILGIELTEEYKQDNTIRNTSLSGIYLELKRVMNKYPIYRTKMNFLVTVLTELQIEEMGVAFYETGIYFNHREQQEFLKQYDECNENVAKTYCAENDAKLFLEKIENTHEEAIAYSSEELLDVCARAFAKHEQSRQEKIEMVVALREKEKNYKESIKSLREDIKYLKGTQSVIKRVLRKSLKIIKGKTQE